MIINRNDYSTKMIELLHDEKTYQLLKLDSDSFLKTLENQHNFIVKRLKKKKYISYHCNLPRIYCCPKMHKNEFPSTLRPIVTAIKTPGSSSYKFLANILKHNQKLVSTKIYFRQVNSSTLRKTGLFRCLISFHYSSIYTQN